jgi:hypothetical protein
MSNPGDHGSEADNITPLMLVLSGAVLAIMIIAYFVA